MFTTKTSRTASVDPAVRRRRRRRLAAVGAVLTVALLSTYAYVSRTGTPSSGPSSVAVADLSDVGEVLVDGQGKALYLFEPDRHASVTCTGGCAQKWPPLALPAAGALPAGPGVRPELLGSVEGEDGSQVVSYAGWPLYRYDSDDPGQTTGDGKDQNGGVWRAVTASGQPAG